MPSDTSQNTTVLERTPLEDELVADIRTAGLTANWCGRLAITATVLTVAASSGAGLAVLLTDQKAIPALLAIIPAVCVALQRSVLDPRVNWHRSKEVALRGLLRRLRDQGATVDSVSRSLSRWERVAEGQWQTAKAAQDEEQPEEEDGKL